MLFIYIYKKRISNIIIKNIYIFYLEYINNFLSIFISSKLIHKVNLRNTIKEFINTLFIIIIIFDYLLFYKKKKKKKKKKNRIIIVIVIVIKGNEIRLFI